MQLKAQNLGFSYSPGYWIFRHLQLQIESGQKIALLGPSGCGKSTLAKVLAQFYQPQEGQIYLNQNNLPAKGFCPVQYIGQNPEKMMNPRLKMAQVLQEAQQNKAQVWEDFAIPTEWLNRYPRELSGGELQRFAIARALAPGVQFVIADEITTMLDAISQAQIWQLLNKQIEDRHLGLLLITHDNNLAQRVCHESYSFFDLRKKE